ncbi:MAG TPA: glycine betaine ABC transporter substrate-binding protein, partial [Longimicrobiales bacterium]|nr:glycine betaine ABC transporter substrate-binding protein [Longimicrobiales bacterium]
MTIRRRREERRSSGRAPASRRRGAVGMGIGLALALTGVAVAGNARDAATNGTVQPSTAERAAGPGPQEASEKIVVASKPFGESYLLAEMFAQLLESRGFEVDRRLGLGATELAFRALRTGAVDVYPEHTGTGLLAVLGEE